MRAAVLLTAMAMPVLAAGESTHHANHLALLVGTAQEVEDGERTSGGMLGVAYERRLSENWYFVSALEQEAFGDKTKRHTIVFAGAAYGITERWSVFGGPGIEGRNFGEREHYLFRLGAGYSLPLSDRFSLKPEFAIDFVEGGTQVYVLALAIGYGF